MTATAANAVRSSSGLPARTRCLRAVLWTLHIFVTAIAVFSLCSNRFNLWVDLRMLGYAGASLVKIVWVSAVLLIPWCAGPRLSGLRKPAWVNTGLSVEWGRRLLWPTFFIIACLLANTVYYYRLRQDNLVETPGNIPITLAMAAVLSLWVLLSREWMRACARVQERAPAPRATQILAVLFALFVVAAVGGFFAIQLYGRPPAQPVDLAVVLGNRVMPDGTASPILRDRTLAAVNLYKRGLVRHLFLSGDVLPGPIGKPLRNEPLAMRQVCIENGIPPSAITMDPHGINTRATAYNARNFMRQRGMATVVACSDDYHLFRTAWSFHEVGINAYTVASIHREWTCAEMASIAREAVAVLVYRFDSAYRAPRDITMKLNAPRVVVRKSAGVLEIFDRPLPDRGETLVLTYACITGGNPGDKAVEGDRKTPLGTFHIVFKNPNSKFHLSLGLDYPTTEDAARGLKTGLITQQEYDGILAAHAGDLRLEETQKKLWYTPLGGEIFIHGHAEGRGATAGCVAVSDPDIEEIYALLPEGTQVEILP